MGWHGRAGMEMVEGSRSKEGKGGSTKDKIMIHESMGSRALRDRRTREMGTLCSHV